MSPLEPPLSRVTFLTVDTEPAALCRLRAAHWTYPTFSRSTGVS